VQPAGRGLEVWVAHAGGVGGMNAAVKPTRTYSRRPLEYVTRTDPCETRATGYTLIYSRPKARQSFDDASSSGFDGCVKEALCAGWLSHALSTRSLPCPVPQIT